MKQDISWDTVRASYNPIVLYKLITKTVLAQTEDQYPIKTVYDQMVSLFRFRQGKMSDAQWHERFHTIVEIAKSLGVSFQHDGLLEYVAKEMYEGMSYSSLSDVQKAAVDKEEEAKFIAYMFLRQSGKQHGHCHTVV